MVRNQKLKFRGVYQRLVATQLLGEFVLIYPLYSIMFGERSGISAAGVGGLLAAWLITQIIAEVPTGIIADRYSKKYSIVAGKALKCLCFVLWFFIPGYGGYLVGFIMWGIGEAFISGAMQAYLYELSEDNKDTSYLKSYSRLKALTMLSYTIAYFCTFLIGAKYQLLIGLSVGTMIATVGVALTLPVTKVLAKGTAKNIFHDSLKTLRRSGVLRRKFVEGLIIAGTLGMLIEYIVVNYRDYGVEPRLVPLLISISTLFNAALFWALHHYEKAFIKHVFLVSLTVTGMFVFMFNQSMWWQVIGLFIVARFMRILAVIQEAGLQDELRDESRATTLSFYSLLDKLLGATQIFLVGAFAVNNSIAQPTFWFVVGSIGLFLTVRLLHSFQSKRRNA